MTELFIPLKITPGLSGIYLNALRGKEEILVDDISTRTALNLLEALITKGTGKDITGNVHAGKIVTADRDRILAQLYISVYGSRVESTLDCEHCRNAFDLDFSMDELLSHYQLTSAEPTEDGSYQIEPGTRFRFPTGEDEVMLAESSPTDAEDFLMMKCFLEGDFTNDRAKVQEAMSEMGPVLNVDMQASCPECGRQQQVQFDIQSFFLTKLRQERPQLIREIHSLAINYHWTQDVILNLPRNLRKQLACLIEAGM